MGNNICDAIGEASSIKVRRGFALKLVARVVNVGSRSGLYSSAAFQPVRPKAFKSGLRKCCFAVTKQSVLPYRIVRCKLFSGCFERRDERFSIKSLPVYWNFGNGLYICAPNRKENVL